MSTRRMPRLGLIPGWVITALVCSSMVYPIVFVLFSASKTKKEYAADPIGLPRSLRLDAIADAWNRGQVARTALNSAVVSLSSVLLLTACATLAAWALATMRFRLRGLTMVGIVGMMMLSPSVLLIPIFVVVRRLDLFNHPLGLILVYTSVHLPFATYLLTSYLRTIPLELIEAAQVDGATHWGTFRRIGLPLARPAIVTVLTLTFLWVWNELLFGLVILQEKEKRTLMAGLAALQGQYTTPVPLLAAGMLLSMIPPLVVFLAFQRNIASGLTAGSLK